MLFADLKAICYITHEENFDSIFELGVLSRQKIINKNHSKQILLLSSQILLDKRGVLLKDPQSLKS